MRHAVEMASDDILYIPNFMKIDSDIQVILRSLFRQIERLQCWYSECLGFMMYVVVLT
jgi:hypothetical protein